MPKLIIANWKSNKNSQEAKQWAEHFTSVEVPADATVVVAPPHSLLTTVREYLPASIHLGAQDVSHFPMGSYTGAVTAQHVQDLSVKYVIVGHSERRRYFHETHQDVAAKLDQVVAAGLTPVLCLDEDYVEEQAAVLESTTVPNLVVAYEPLAAIGTGNNAPADQVESVIQKIHSVFGEVPVIYGGSVDERSVKEYLMISDGVLVGSASLDAQQFNKIVNAVAT